MKRIAIFCLAPLMAFSGITYDRDRNVLSYVSEEGANYHIDCTIDTASESLTVNEEGSQTLYRFSADGFTRIAPDGTALSYSYQNELLHRLEASDQSCGYRFHYDSRGETVLIEDLCGNCSLKRRYDSEGRLAYEEFLGGYALRYEYGADYRKILLPDGSAIKYIYNGESPSSIERLDDACRILYVWRAGEELILDLGRVVAGENSKQDPWLKFTLKESEKEDLIEAELGVLRVVYDEKGQIVREGEDCYEYDALGNRVIQNGRPCQVDRLCRLRFDGVSHYQYDACGNLSQKETNGKIWRYTYDALGRQIGAAGENMVIQYVYDGLNRRLGKKVWKAGDLIEELFFLYDGFKEIGAMNGRGCLGQLRVLKDHLISEAAAAVAIEIDGEVYAPLHDMQGSVCGLVSAATRSPVEFYRYSAFGKEEVLDANFLRIEQSMVRNPWRFAAKRVDETGLVFFGRRYLDPDCGRWITPDPEGFVDGINRYLFAANSPLRQSDAFGLFTINPLNYLRFAYSFARREFLQLVNHMGSNVNTIGATIHFIGNHVMPFPYLRDILIAYGRSIHCDITKSEFFNPYVHTIGQTGHNHPNARIGYLNGIMNITSEYYMSAAAMLTEFSRGAVILDLFYMPSRGIFLDLLDAVFLKLNIPTQNSDNFAEDLHDILKETREQNPSAKYLLILHSKAALVAERAIRRLSPEEKEMLEVLNIAPAYIMEKTICSRVYNVISKWDIVPLQNFIPMLRYLFFDDETVLFISPKGGFPLGDHSFEGKTYQDEVKRRIEDFLERQEVALPIDPAS